MRVLVVGGGPGGLFFALLAKRALPDLDIHVVEQNPEGATYGWGVVFTDRAVDALRPAAPDVLGEIASRDVYVEHMDIVVREECLNVHGNVFHRIGRVDLLELLQRHAREAGVTIEFERRVTDRAELEDWDMVVGADGINSVVRDLYAEAFAPEVRFGRNWWAWYGTDQLFPAVSLIFEPTPDGLFIGHAYQYGGDRSGFVAEVVPEAYAAGLSDLDDDSSRARCQDVFAGHLGGHHLLDNRSVWFRPKFVSCERWVAGHVTLLGDALHTVHPSIGSGTRFAMRDAVRLAEALIESNSNIPGVLQRYEALRRPVADRFQAAARRSISWYEGLAGRDLGDPTRFAIEYTMRTGRVRYEEFRRLNRELVSAYERPGERAPQLTALAGDRP